MPTAAEPAAADRTLHRALRAVVPAERLKTRYLDRVAFASDASFYRLIPRAVVFAATRAEVRGLFAVSHARRVPLTFRAAGTSLSGQAISDGILVEVGRHWRSLQIEDRGRRIRVQPGVIGADANRALAPLGYKLGPDPASLDACQLGGILSNNASGMCCGVRDNAYHTLESLTFVLPSGTQVDSGAADARAQLAAAEPALCAGLAQLRDRVRGDAQLAAQLRAAYRLKNTVGYGLNAFLDYDDPLDIFSHLLIGAEGTLAFIAEAVLRTVPLLPVRVTGLLLLADLPAACAAIRQLSQAGAAALELMDRASLASVADQPGMPPEIRGLPSTAAALLVEFQAPTGTAPAVLHTCATAAAAGLPLLHPARFTSEAPLQQQIWRVRKGLFPSVGAVRQRGTAVIIEDVVFPPEHLAEAAVGLQRLFVQHGYPRAILFGHAKDGNLHFVLTQSFADQAAIDQYRRLMDDVAALVVSRFGGALKGEHGTGRNMAPFLELQWGAQAVAVMRRVKQLADPTGLLNPGVILNADPAAHLRDLKSLPPIDLVADRCTECGFCEPRCPSRDLTRTPRQRIVVQRELARLATGGGPAALRTELEAVFAYDVLDTCATDGLCATACPVAIDTGALVKHLRAQRHRPWQVQVAGMVEANFADVERLVRLGLGLVGALRGWLGEQTLRWLGDVLWAASARRLPRYIPPLPAPAPRLPATDRAGAVAVYFPSCLTRTLGALPGETRGAGAAGSLVEIAKRAGRPVWIPLETAGHCCGLPFSSKGFADAHAAMVNRTIAALWRWSDSGALPIVSETSACVGGLRACRPALSAQNAERFNRLRFVDAVAFVAEELLPRLLVRRRDAQVVLHPTCSLIGLGGVDALVRIAAACATEVFIPPSTGCCGFAGDRGWLVPELTAAATAAVANEVRAQSAAGYFSTSRTCEIGMTRATGRAYRSVLHLVEQASRPA